MEVAEAERLDDEEEAEGLGRPDQHGQDAEEGNLPGGQREDALLEALVEVAHATGQRQAGDQPAAEIAQREEPHRERDDHDDTEAEDELDRRRQAGAKAPEAGGKAEDGDGEEVEDALDEDGPEGPAQRGGVIQAQ